MSSRPVVVAAVLSLLILGGLTAFVLTATDFIGSGSLSGGDGRGAPARLPADARAGVTDDGPGTGSGVDSAGALSGPGSGSGPGATGREATGGGPGGGSGPAGAGTESGGADDSGEEAAGADSAGGAAAPRGTAGLLAYVEDGNHLPVSDVRVSVDGPGGEHAGVTDSQGVVVFEGLAVGSYRAFVEPPGGGSLEASKSVAVTGQSLQEVRFVVLPFDATIRGRVIDDGGQALEGVGVSALPLGREEGENPLISRGGPTEVLTDGGGHFEITGLAAGEHILRTRPTEQHPSVRRNVNAPAEGVDVVLYAEETIVASGVVTDPDGLALPGASIVSSANGERTESAGDGSYGLELRARLASNVRVVLTASLEGYVRAEQILPRDRVGPADESGLRTVEVNFTLEPLGENGVLRGSLSGPEGEPVTGERVYLHSSSLKMRYYGNSGADGRFEIAKIRLADDYRLWVYPRSGYRDETIAPLTILRGENEIDIVLERTEEGSLEGLMLDSEGRVVPRFTIHVRSLDSLANAITTTTDDAGGFRIDRVPAGELLIETRALPKLSVRGVKVEPGRETYVEIPTGKGPHTVTGTVSTAAGDSPVAGARVIVTWSGSRGQIRSSLFNESVTDARGQFDMSGFGVGECSVSVMATGYRSARQNFKIGPGGAPPQVIRIVQQPEK